MTELVLPWPDRSLHPNARVHWSKRAKAAKAARQQAWAETINAKWSAPDSDRLHLWIDFYPPDRRRRDDDGLLAAFKPWRDGIADALGIDDCIFVSHPWIKGETREGGEVRVRMTQGPGEA